MRSRRNFLDEIDASTLRFLRSRVHIRRTLAVLARAMGPPVGAGPPGRRRCDTCVAASALVPLTDGRHEGRAQRSGDRSNVGLSQRTRGRPAAVSPREPFYDSTGRVGGQGDQPSMSLRRTGGGDEGTRTPDPLLAKEVLSQLSYIPATERMVSAMVVRVKAPQRKTTVRSPCSRTRCSTCQRTDLASATHSRSRPTRAISATL
jgi:hypothetical protein